MFRKIISLCVFSGAAFGLSGCEYMRTHTAQDFFTGSFFEQKDPETNYVYHETTAAAPKQPKSIVVCRSQQCAPAKLSMSKEYIYNSLLQLFENNNYQRILLCQADPQSHVCLEEYVTLPLIVGAVPTNAYIDYAKITDMTVGKGGDSINLILNYNITYGGQTADCTPAQTLLFARNVDHVIMEDTGYNCKMTTIGTTNVKTVFTIDYIDLDYGYIGGYYSIGFSGPSYGGGNGYMLLRMLKNAYPLTPALKAPKKLSASKNTAAKLKLPTVGSTNPNASLSDEFQSNDVEVFPIEKTKPQPAETKE